MSERDFKNMTEALRHCINEDETSFVQLGKQTGILRQTLVRFAGGEQSIHLRAADVLSEHYGLRVMQPAKRKGG